MSGGVLDIQEVLLNFSLVSILDRPSFTMALYFFFYPG